MKQLEEENDFGKKQGGADLFFKFLEGENRIRILSKGEVIGQHFLGKGTRPSTCYGVTKGCPLHEENYFGDEPKEFPKVSIKYQVYLLDRADGAIKVADLPYTVIKKIAEFQEDEDYKFDTFPMPYDIKVTYKPNESAGNMYSVIASPKREEITAEVSSALKSQEEKYPISEAIQKKKDAQIQVHKEQGIWVSPEMHKENYDKKTAEINTGKAKMPTVQLDEVAEYVDTKYPENNLGSGPEDF